MSKRVIKNLIKGCGRSLRTLNLSFIQQVDDDVVKFIGREARNDLRVLELRYCKKITDNGMIDLCQGLSGFAQWMEE